ncbi:MAG: ADP-ribosylation factor-directed GTPase activating protein isoform b [Pirellulales bacterium]|nr:ADP-ribosylation factor-directed GTPase activating protein isoform b [Pirellulales bacterium]
MFLGLLTLPACNRNSAETGSENPTATATAEGEAAPLPEGDALRQRIDAVIDFTRARQMKVEEQAAWQIVHGILCFGPQLQIEVGGKPVSALDYLLGGGQLKGWIMRPADHGVEAIVEAGSKTGQGHKDQWLGYLCQSGLSIDHPLRVGDKDYTLKDLLTQAQWECTEGMEASWTLMATCTWLPLDATWQARDGSEWSTERLLAMEIAQDLGESSCGGTHRMSGITMAVNRWKAEGRELTGTWKEADDLIQSCLDKARDFQQPDGTFSANFFVRPAAAHEVADQLHCLGHTFEFCCYALPHERLAEPWMVKAAVQLCELLELTRDHSLECGALYHAAHGLVLYREHRFGAPAAVAEAAAPSNTAR